MSHQDWSSDYEHYEDTVIAKISTINVDTVCIGVQLVERITKSNMPWWDISGAEQKCPDIIIQICNYSV